jgi:hypothetical protein
MLRRVALVRTDVSEERSAFFIRVTRIGELGTTLAVTSNRRTLRRIPEDAILRSHRRENLKSYLIIFMPDDSQLISRLICAGLTTRQPSTRNI